MTDKLAIWLSQWPSNQFILPTNQQTEIKPWMIEWNQVNDRKGKKLTGYITLLSKKNTGIIPGNTLHQHNDK